MDVVDCNSFSVCDSMDPLPATCRDPDTCLKVRIHGDLNRPGRALVSNRPRGLVGQRGQSHLEPIRAIRGATRAVTTAWPTALGCVGSLCFGWNHVEEDAAVAEKLQAAQKGGEALQGALPPAYLRKRKHCFHQIKNPALVDLNGCLSPDRDLEGVRPRLRATRVFEQIGTPPVVTHCSRTRNIVQAFQTLQNLLERILCLFQGKRRPNST
eukprot:scaffold5766_cov256-Pinguiococcus_pyrenoidosus.AAC.15